MSLTTARDPLDQESEPEREHTNRHFVGFVQGFIASTSKKHLGTYIPGCFFFLVTHFQTHYVLLSLLLGDSLCIWLRLLSALI